MLDINFVDQDDLQLDEEKLQSWLAKVVEKHNCELGEVTYVFCSDDYLLEVNKQYLNHDYFTDIITFDYTDNSVVSGDLFISLDRIRDYSNTQNIEMMNELHRVMVHGVLHLCGFKDKSKEEELMMRHLEDEALLMM
jgi:probable rRNA maturation factor